MIQPLRTTLMATLLAVLAACAQTPPQQGEGTVPDLSGTNWLLVSALGAETVAGGKITFDDAGGINGNSGCNAFTGSYTSEAGALTFGPIAMTRMACQGVADATERAFMAALEATRGATSVGGDLVLVGADDQPLARLTPI